MRHPIALFGSSVNPAGFHHRRVVECLVGAGFKVKIVPCGLRPDKLTVNDVLPLHRIAMTEMTFGDLVETGDVEMDFFDLAGGTFTRTWALQDRYEREGELWHSVGTDLIAGGG